jgi:hypothetical protein
MSSMSIVLTVATLAIFLCAFVTLLSVAFVHALPAPWWPYFMLALVVGYLVLWAIKAGWKKFHA